MLSARTKTAPVILKQAPWFFAVSIVLLLALAVAGSWNVAESAPPWEVVLWMLPSVIVGSVFVGFGVYFLRASMSRRTRAEGEDDVLLPQARLLLLVFSAFSLTVLLGASLYVYDLRKTLRQQRFSQQTAVAALKAQQLEKWLAERSVDVQLVATVLQRMKDDVADLDRDETQLTEVVFAEVLAAHPERVGVALFAPDGTARIRVGSDSAIPADDLRAAAATASQQAGRLRVTELRALGADPSHWRLGFFLPIPSRSASGTAAVLAIIVDPSIVMLPQLRRWPTASTTSEIVLIERMGDEVVVITPPAGMAPLPPGGLRIPVSDLSRTAVQTVLHGDSTREGLDYRGIPVLSASQSVAGMPWHVLAKTDVAEVMLPIDRRSGRTAAISIAAIVVVGLTTLMLWRADRTSYRALRAHHELERAALTQHYEQMIRQARDCVLLADPQGRIIDANEAAIAAYGYSLDEFRKLRSHDLRTPEEQPKLEGQWAAQDSAGGALIETVHRRKDGSTLPVEISGRLITIDGQAFRQGFVRDISQRKAMEAELKRLSRVQRALQAATALMLRATSEDELLTGMCEVIVGVGGYRMADVAVANHDAGKTVSFRAIAGHEDGYLAGAALSWGDVPRGRGPTGSALRTGQVQVNQDFATNEAIALWRAEALKRGYRASIALPLSKKGAMFGALTIYAEQPFAFDGEEMMLLSQFAADISYGLTALHDRTTAGAAGRT